MLLCFGDKRPRIDPSALILEPCIIAGDVVIGALSSVWFNAVIRGDVGPVRIGSRVNVQDGCVLHESLGRTPCVVEDDVTIGHRAIVHGATLRRACLIGMGAVVMDEAVVGAESIVGAGAVVPERMVVPDGHLAVGVPARVVRPLTPEERARLLASAELYVQYATKYLKEGSG